MAPGRYLPGAPTDPDVQNSRIRLLELLVRCSSGHWSCYARLRKRIPLQQCSHAFPVNARALRAAVKPLAPHANHLPPKPLECPEITDDPVISVVASQLSAEGLLLYAHGSVSMPSTPKRHVLECSPKTVACCLALQEPFSFARHAPEVRSAVVRRNYRGATTTCSRLRTTKRRDSRH